MSLLSVVTPCYNEESNVAELHERVAAALASVGGLEYEHIFIDNASTDDTVGVLRRLAARDTRVRVIINARNFGHIRSPYHAMLQAGGDAVMLVVADLQDPPELIPEFVRKWREGSLIVAGIKAESQESATMFAIRKAYYGFVARIGEHKLLQNFTGFGLYDRRVLDAMRRMNEP